MDKDVPTWLNSFLFWDAVVVWWIVAIDWWMGNKQRKRLLRQCRRIFADFRKRNVFPIYTRQATACLAWIEYRLGAIGTLRFLITSALIALIPTAIVLTLVSVQLRSEPGFAQAYPNYGWWGTAKTIACNAIAITIVFCLSVLLSTSLLRATRRLLPIGPSKPGNFGRSVGPALTKLVALAAGSAGLLVVGMIAFLWLAETLSHHPLPQTMPFQMLMAKISGTIPHYMSGVNTPHYRWTTGLLIVLAVAPLIVHLAVSVLFLLGRAVSTILNRFLSTLLLRVSQGEDGLLRQIAIFLGAGAKLIEMGLKAF